MREDYKAAKKLGDEAVREANKKGISPYLPVLDTMEAVKDNVGQTRLGLMELPIERIKGNKEAARNNAFANNFMPLFEDGTEFAVKWSSLYDSYQQEGIRDAIKVYEFMNNYYVQEGNKRVSVSRYGGTEFILADVTRIIPRNNGTKEVKVYYEYMDFYKVTKNFLIVFSEPGAYKKLADMLEQDLENEWPESLCLDLKSAFFRFSKNLKKEMNTTNEYLISDAFLFYISIFPFKTIEDSSDDQIINNIRLVHKEFMSLGGVEDINFLDNAPIEEEKPAGIMSLFTRAKKYTAASPLRVAFLYDHGIEESRWIDSHEAGRLYVDEMTGDNVVTNAYSASELGGTQNAIEKALKDKNEIVFSVSPHMLKDILQVSIRNPEVRFLNCSVGNTYSSIRCYQGKFYEAAFLMGVYAADVQLLDSEIKGERKIGYLLRDLDRLSAANLNAFAIGVSMVDPDCKVVLTTPKDSDDTSYREEWIQEGIKYYADIESAAISKTTSRQGVFKIGPDRDKYIGSAYYSWGKYYVQIVQSVLSGAWTKSAQNTKNATNYWFGLSTGVVDIRIPSNVYQTKKMLSFMKNSVIRGELGPFSGEIHSRDGEIYQVQQIHNKRGVSLALDKIDDRKLIKMEWLNENIIGELPE